MKTIILLSVYLLSMPSIVLATLSQVPFGGVKLQLQSSTTEKDPETLLVEVLTQTVKYLDKSFSGIYEGTETDFSHIGLSVDNFDIDPSFELDSVSFTFSGTAFFESDIPPSEEEVLKALTQSFLGRNSQKFTGTLMQAPSPFLQRLSYAVVQVHGYASPESATEQEDAAVLYNEEPEKTIEIKTVAIIVGSVSGALLLLLLCYCFWCFGDDCDPEESEDEQPSKPTIATSRTSETQDIEAMISPAPSSPQSIGSQDSSVFTYNPSSKMSFDASTLSTNTNDTGNLDLASWQQKNIINNSRFAPFGHDISAIEMLNDNKKDLSLIEEGDESATPAKNSEKYLSREYLSTHDRASDRYHWEEESQSNDVVEDLVNLSQQINYHRRR